MTKHSENPETATCDNNVLANRLFQPIAIDYNLGSVNGFDRVNIVMKNNKYLIYLYFV